MLDNDLNARASATQAKAAQAYVRLLRIAETGQGGQAKHVARFTQPCHVAPWGSGPARRVVLAVESHVIIFPCAAGRYFERAS